MSENLAELSYSNRDYQNIKQELLAKIPLITSKWTDWNQADLGITILELFTGIADMMSFYMDRNANECLLPTARVRKSVSDLCKLIDYELYPSQAASITETITLANSYPFDVTFPKGFRISTTDPKNKITYSLVEDTTFIAGEVVKTATMGEGIRNEYTYTSSGTSNLSITIPVEIQQPPDQETFVQVYVNSTLWTEEYNTLLGLTQSYLIDISNPNSTIITFGDGTNGLIPPAGSTILIIYWTGNGIFGRVGAGTVTYPEAALIVSGTTISFTATNADSSIGGDDKETIEHAKYWAPKELRTGDRLVTLEDYDTFASTYNKSGIGTIAIAKSYWKSSDLYACEMDLYVLSRDISGNYVAASQALKDALLADIEERRCLVQHTNIYDGVLYPIILDLNVYITEETNPTTVSAEIITELSQYIQSLGFGSTLYISKIIDLVMTVDGVYNVVMNNPVADVSVGANTVITVTDVVVSTFN